MAMRWPSSSTWSTGLMPSRVPATAARAGQPPAPLEEHQVVHREPGADGGRQLPGIIQRLVKAGPCLPLAGYQIGKQPLAHAGLFGIHTGDAAAGELFLQHFGGHAAGLIGPRQPTGKGQVQNILPSCQHRGERILVIGQGHLAGGAGTARPQLFVIVVGADLPPVGPVAVGLPSRLKLMGRTRSSASSMRAGVRSPVDSVKMIYGCI